MESLNDTPMCNSEMVHYQLTQKAQRSPPRDKQSCTHSCNSLECPHGEEDKKEALSHGPLIRVMLSAFHFRRHLLNNCLVFLPADTEDRCTIHPCCITTGHFCRFAFVCLFVWDLQFHSLPRHPPMLSLNRYGPLLFFGRRMCEPWDSHVWVARNFTKWRASHTCSQVPPDDAMSNVGCDVIISLQWLTLTRLEIFEYYPSNFHLISDCSYLWYNCHLWPL